MTKKRLLVTQGTSNFPKRNRGEQGEKGAFRGEQAADSAPALRPGPGLPPAGCHRVGHRHRAACSLPGVSKHRGAVPRAWCHGEGASGSKTPQGPEQSPSKAELGVVGGQHSTTRAPPGARILCAAAAQRAACGAWAWGAGRWEGARVAPALPVLASSPPHNAGGLGPSRGSCRRGTKPAGVRAEPQL